MRHSFEFRAGFGCTGDSGPDSINTSTQDDLIVSCSRSGMREDPRQEKPIGCSLSTECRIGAHKPLLQCRIGAQKHPTSTYRMMTLMANIPWLDRATADDPFGPMFQSVSELTSRIKRTLERDFAEVALKGEVSNVARPRSGHVYFTLKDDSASIRAVMWKSDARLGLRSDRRAGRACAGATDRLRTARENIRSQSSRSSPRGSEPSNWHFGSDTPNWRSKACSTPVANGRCRVIRVGS